MCLYVDINNIIYRCINIYIYVNRQQAINSKSINDTSSGGDVDLAIFLSRRCRGQRGSEGGVKMARRDEFTREMNANFNVVVDNVEEEY